MARVTLTDGETPSAKLVAAAAKSVDVTDALGRTIVLRKPDVLAQFRMVEALGDSARNQVYMGMVLPLLFVASIDGEAVATPDTKAEVEALIKRLDEAGIQAVMEGVQAHFGEAADPETARKN